MEIPDKEFNSLLKRVEFIAAEVNELREVLKKYETPVEPKKRMTKKEQMEADIEAYHIWIAKGSRGKPPGFQESEKKK